jgi:hypothetical protein
VLAARGRLDGHLPRCAAGDLDQVDRACGPDRRLFVIGTAVGVVVVTVDPDDDGRRRPGPGRCWYGGACERAGGEARREPFESTYSSQPH